MKSTPSDHSTEPGFASQPKLQVTRYFIEELRRDGVHRLKGANIRNRARNKYGLGPYDILECAQEMLVDAPGGIIEYIGAMVEEKICRTLGEWIARNARKKAWQKREDLTKIIALLECELGLTQE